MAQDSLSVAPKDFNLSILKAMEPFLRIHRPSELRSSGLDKFEGGAMKGETMLSFLHTIGRKVSEIERKYNQEQGTELNLQLRDVELVGLIEPFTSFTEHELVNSQCPEDEKDEEDDEDDADEEQCGFNFQYGSDLAQNYQADCGAILIHDKSPLKQPQLSQLVKSELSTQRCAVVMKFKAKEDPDGIFQAAADSRPEILRNLSNKHYKPMCLLVFSKFMFTYGFIKYEGSICASGESLSDFAYEAFCKTCQDPRRHTLREDLDELYRLRLQYLRSIFNPNAYYKAKDYIVGDLYMSPEWHALPTMKTQSGCVSAGSRKFYEGLLRVVIGDRVVKWDFSDLLPARGIREVQSYRQAEVGGLDMSEMIKMEMLLLDKGVRECFQLSGRLT